MEDKHNSILFGQRKHRTFSYKPRFSKNNKEDANKEEDSKSKEFVSKWRQQTGHKVRMKGIMPVRTLILVLLLLLICMYLLEKEYM